MAAAPTADAGVGVRDKRKPPPPRAEADGKTKSGTAWSHGYLNQKPWHPLSYQNQRRKWIAEQEHAEGLRRSDEVAKEFAQEQSFFSHAAQLSKAQKAKVEAMQAVSFMYIRPPGYNAEGARAAELADEQRRLRAAASDGNGASAPEAEADPLAAGSGAGGAAAGAAEEGQPRPARAKDAFGRTVATEQDFPQLKGAPRLDTGVVGRAKPFGVEVRNVRCARCGALGHQAGDRECPQRDVILPGEEERRRREDPLTVFAAAHGGPEEPLRWELKVAPGSLSPARGGFRPDDPNQQILASDHIFDEYGGFLESGGGGGGSGVADQEEGASATAAIPAAVMMQLTSRQRKRLARAYEGRDDEARRKRRRRRRDDRNKQEEEEARGTEKRGRGESLMESLTIAGAGRGNEVMALHASGARRKEVDGEDGGAERDNVGDDNVAARCKREEEAGGRREGGCTPALKDQSKGKRKAAADESSDKSDTAAEPAGRQSRLSGRASSKRRKGMEEAGPRGEHRSRKRVVSSSHGGGDDSNSVRRKRRRRARGKKSEECSSSSSSAGVVRRDGGSRRRLEGGSVCKRKRPADAGSGSSSSDSLNRNQVPSAPLASALVPS
eukprot:SM000119S25649  [mRNA]  locus=s119:217461:220452:+ [translate_table: standard]